MIAFLRSMLIVRPLLSRGGRPPARVLPMMAFLAVQGLMAQTTVTVSPTTKTLSVGASTTFTATVTGATDTSVTWSSSPTAGLVSSSGVFTAPATAGTFTAKATSNADSTKSASATVTVVALSNATITASPWAGAGLAGIKASVPSVSGSTYLWTVTGGTITAGGTTNQVTYTAGSVGTLTLQCRVTNAAGDSATGSAQQTLTSVLDISGAFTSTNPGTVTFYQTGTSVYGLQSGVLKFQGTLSGQVLSGTQPGTAYYFKFTFAPDGGSFTGMYNSPTSACTSGNVGSGTRQTGVVSIDLNPKFNVIQVNGTQAMTAVVAGSLDKTYTLNATAGSVSGGTFTAPATPQMTTLTATATADATKTSTFTSQVTTDGLLDISGTFTGTNPGTVTFYQTGTSVYGLQSGVLKFQGTLSGQVLSGTQPGTAYYFKFTFAPDGGSFTGLYNCPTSACTSGNVGSGTRQTGVVSIDLNPKFNVIQVNGTQAMTAVVAGSLVKDYSLSATSGSFTNGTFTAPATPQMTTLTATATADATKTSTFTSQVTTDGLLDISGTFTGTNPGTVTFYQTGTSVYGLQSGVVKFQGTLNGRVLNGVDPTKTSSQYFTFTFSADGSSFTGFYNSSTSPATSGTVASGTRQAGVVSIDLNPKFNVIQVNGTQAMTAVVAGSLVKDYSLSATSGSFSGGTFTAPATPQLTTLTATATADATKTSTFTSQVTTDGLLDISGTFTGTNPGTVTFYQTGTSVYGLQSGVVKFQGTLNGRVLNGVDPTKTSSQYFTFTFSADGSSFTGYYGSSTSPATSGYVGNGTRQAGVVSMWISPATATVPSDQTQQFLPLVAGSLDKRQTLSVQEAGGGTVTSGALYTPPALAGTYHLNASAVVDPTKTASSTITVPVVVRVNPASLQIASGSTQAFTATVLGTANQAVSWVIQEGTAGGTVDATGHYTAPSTGSGTFHLVVTSAQDGTFPTTVLITVTGPQLPKLSIAPSQTNMSKGGTQTFVASVQNASDPTVTWSCTGGSIDQSGNYTAPNVYGTFTVTAALASDPTIRDTATVVVPGGTASGAFTYDLNGNLTSDGTRTFTWDAENRLVSVTIVATGHVSQFVYDELGRRVEIVEKDGGTVSDDTRYLWDGIEIAEARNATGGTVLKHFYSQGFVDSDGTNLYYTRDHLGSVRELTDSTQAIRARYDYDPYGRMTKISGDKDTVFGYTGHMWHAQSGLNFTWYRAYDPALGRWISEDPIGIWGGMNLYRYVNNNPISFIDELGLKQTCCEIIQDLIREEQADYKYSIDYEQHLVLVKASSWGTAGAIGGAIGTAEIGGFEGAIVGGVGGWGGGFIVGGGQFLWADYKLSKQHRENDEIISKFEKSGCKDVLLLRKLKHYVEHDTLDIVIYWALQFSLPTEK